MFDVTAYGVCVIYRKLEKTSVDQVNIQLLQSNSRPDSSTLAGHMSTGRHVRECSASLRKKKRKKRNIS